MQILDTVVWFMGYLCILGPDFKLLLKTGFHKYCMDNSTIYFHVLMSTVVVFIGHFPAFYVVFKLLDLNFFKLNTIELNWINVLNDFSLTHSTKGHTFTIQIPNLSCIRIPTALSSKSFFLTSIVNHKSNAFPILRNECETPNLVGTGKNYRKIWDFLGQWIRYHLVH